jgi:dTDP-glucose 4,6-dehydratase
LGAISPTRDFNYVQDTIAGFLAALKTDRGVGEVVNLGSNFEISIGETAMLIAEVTNSEIEIITDEERLRPDKSEVERLWAANKKAAELFDWKPEYGERDGFRRGLAETVSWFCRQANLSRYKTDIYNM